MSNTFHYDYYSMLKGQRVVGIVKDAIDPKIHGLLFGNNKVAWILRDEEGNGEGFLQICDYK